MAFSVEGGDPDGDNLILSYESDDIPQAAIFRDNRNGTGTFTWHTGYDDAGDYAGTITLSDGDLSVAADFQISVENVNLPPEWTSVPDEIEGIENTTIDFIIQGADPDDDDLAITFTSDDLPEEARFLDFGNGAGRFSWRPNLVDAGDYTALFSLSDGEFDVEAEVEITVANLNQTPAWAEFPDDIVVDEGQYIEFMVVGMDSDPSDELTVTFSSIELQPVAQFTDHGDGSGTFSWQTTFEDAGEYVATFTLSDGMDDISGDVNITVNNVNRPPSWISVNNNQNELRVDEGDIVRFTARGYDPDDDDLTITFDRDLLPDEAEFTIQGPGVALFVWQTTHEDFGVYDLTLTLSDGEYEDSFDMQLLVGDVDRPPVWTRMPDNLRIDENALLQFQVVGRDPDDDELTLELSSDDLPDDVEFTIDYNGAGTFRWEPGYGDAGEYTATFTLSDGENSIVSDVNIVVNDINLPPYWVVIPDVAEIREDEEFISFNVEAADPDGDELTISYSSDNLPEDARFGDFGDGTGNFVWLITYDDAGHYTATFTVSDGEYEVTEDVTINVINVNREPSWTDVPEEIRVAENELILFTVEGSDPDGDDLLISYTSNGIPRGATFVDNYDGTGTFRWNTTYADQGDYIAWFTLSDRDYDVVAEVPITVTNVNRAPRWTDYPDDMTVTAFGDEPTDIRVQAVDDDGDQIIYTWRFIGDELNDADFEVVDGAAVLTINPTRFELGDYQVRFAASDGRLSTRLVIDINVVSQHFILEAATNRQHMVRVESISNYL
ncbi:MAG TPA: tandem-95 repeat protein, partial [Bacteroidetes bacterium]|nr:tandem-95 repeat protein [Bacteroidota bacterium]